MELPVGKQYGVVCPAGIDALYHLFPYLGAQQQRHIGQRPGPRIERPAALPLGQEEKSAIFVEMQLPV